MAEGKITTAELARRTALSQTTIRSVRKGTGRHEGHTLMVLAACLGLHNQYLREVLAGRIPSALEPPMVRVERKLDELLTVA